GNLFLDSQVNIGTNSNVKQSLIKGQDDHLKQQNKHLQELLKSKDDQLKGKEEIINVYREQIQQLKKLRK
ncbi:MAG: hypothetical protein PHD97_12680, partial [Bacteroidales bacterium]|nr:hypothetical protein [Bacteroidales bacterium]